MSDLRKIALVVGQTNYTGASHLYKAAAEAADMGDKLKKCGFDVIRAFDVTREDFTVHLTDLENRVKASKQKPLVLFHYTGHGALHHNVFRMLTTEYRGSTPGVNPAAAVQGASVAIDEVLRHMQSADRCVFILDACRITPTPGSADGTTCISVPAPRQGSPPILWACACWDGSATPANNSFTSILLQELFRPGVTLISAVGQANERRPTSSAGPVMSQQPHKFDFSLAQGYDAAASNDAHPPAHTAHQVAVFAAEELQRKTSALEQSLRSKARIDKNYCMIVVENQTQWEFFSPSVQYGGGFGEPFRGCKIESIKPMTGAAFAFQPTLLLGGSNGLIKYSIDGRSFFYLQWNRPGPEGNDPKKLTGLAKAFTHGARLVATVGYRAPTRPCWKAMISSDNKLTSNEVANTGEDQVDVEVCNEYFVGGSLVRVTGKMENVCLGLSKLRVTVAPAANQPS